MPNWFDSYLLQNYAFVEYSWNDIEIRKTISLDCQMLNGCWLIVCSILYNGHTVYCLCRICKLLPGSPSILRCKQFIWQLHFWTYFKQFCFWLFFNESKNYTRMQSPLFFSFAGIEMTLFRETKQTISTCRICLPFLLAEFVWRIFATRFCDFLMDIGRNFSFKEISSLVLQYIHMYEDIFTLLFFIHLILKNKIR